MGLVIGVLVKLSFDSIPVLNNIELLTLDYRFRLFSNSEKASKDIVIVVIDQASLDYLEYPRDDRESQYWPWDRFVYANILDYIRPGNPKAIIFDLTLKRINEAGDDQFAQSMANSGNTYCPLVFTREKDVRYTKTIEESAKQILAEKFAVTSSLISELSPEKYNMVYPPNAVLLPAPKRLGAVNIDKDSDGILRRVSLFFEYDGKIYPSLACSTALDINSSIDKIYQSGGISAKSEMHIWWYGKARTYKYIPFSDLYEDWYLSKTGKQGKIIYKSEDFKDKIVLVGDNAPAHGDLHSNPLQSAYPGVEAQATILDNLISGTCLIPSSNKVKWFISLLLCVITGLFLFIHRSFVRGMVWGGLVFIIFFTVNCISFSKYHYWLELSVPFSGMFLTFTSSTLIYYFTEGREKRRIRNSFSKYVAPDVVDEILKDYKNIRADVGERRELTVLFSDIRGFTTISESRPPEKVVKLLNEYLSKMVEVIFRYGGTLDKFIGDGIMVFFGAPKEQANGAQLAVKCAIEMVKQARILQEKWKAEGNPNLNIGVGINTGDVIVGNIGSEKRLDYTVIGDNVNTASRLESLNKDYHTNIIISQSTKDKLQEHFDLKELGEASVKGKEKAVVIYEVKIG